MPYGPCPLYLKETESRRWRLVSPPFPEFFGVCDPSQRRLCLVVTVFRLTKSATGPRPCAIFGVSEPDRRDSFTPGSSDVEKNGFGPSRLTREQESGRRSGREVFRLASRGPFAVAIFLPSHFANRFRFGAAGRSTDIRVGGADGLR